MSELRSALDGMAEIEFADLSDGALLELVAEWSAGVVMRVPLSADGSRATAKPTRFLTGIGKPVAVVLDGSALLVGDWTSRDPAITAFLQENHRDGVPLYVYYAGPDAAPVVLPQILDTKIVTAALR